MPNVNQKSNQDTESPVNLNDESLEDILASVDQFIDNVYRNLDMTPTDTPSRSSSLFRSRRSPNNSISPTDSPAGAASISPSSPNENPENSGTPSRRLNIDAEVERINHMCDRVEMNLRSIGVFMNRSGSRSVSEDRSSTNTINSPPPMLVLSRDSSSSRATSPSSSSGRRGRSTRARETVTVEMTSPIIDLSESQTDTQAVRLNNTNNHNDEEEDDDVILVSSNLQPVVDLCTPSDHRETFRRRRRHIVNHTSLNRRRLAIPVDNNVDDCMEGGESTSPRKRRRGNRMKSLGVPETEITENSPPPLNFSSDRSPYTCAVCLESYCQRQPTTTRCGHVFCQSCIKQAIRLTHKCPMCKAKVTSSQIHRLYL